MFEQRICASLSQGLLLFSVLCSAICFLFVQISACPYHCVPAHGVSLSADFRLSLNIPRFPQHDDCGDHAHDDLYQNFKNILFRYFHRPVPVLPALRCRRAGFFIQRISSTRNPIQKQSVLRHPQTVFFARLQYLYMMPLRLLLLKLQRLASCLSLGVFLLTSSLSHLQCVAVTLL